METKFRWTLVSLNEQTRRTVNKSLLKYYNFLIDYDFKTDNNVYVTYKDVFDDLYEFNTSNQAIYYIITQIYKDCRFT